MIKEIIEKYLKEEMSEQDLLLESFNEKSFQHNLGEHLRKKLGNKYLIQYERNINYFDKFSSFKSLKTEVDILVLEKEDELDSHDYNSLTPYAIIEIKFIRQFSETFVETASPTSALKNHFVDIAFCDQLKKEGIEESISLLLTDYNFKKPCECFHKPLWDAYYKNDLNDLQEILRKIEESNSSNNQHRDAVDYFRKSDNGWTKDFFWKNTKVGNFTDEKGNKLTLKYMLI